MTENLTHTDWSQIQARPDVLSLLDQQEILLQAPLGQGWYGLCWNSERFTLRITKLAGQHPDSFLKTHLRGRLTEWAYLQVDEQRPNYRILLKMVYDSQQQSLQVQLVKDAKLRFPGSEGDIRLQYC